MVGWHHQFNGHEFEQTPGDGEEQGSLACCSPWGCNELDTSERLINNMELLVETRPLRSHDSRHTAHTVNPPSGMLAPGSARKFTHIDLQQTDNQLFVQQKKGLFGINIESCTQVSTEQENSFTEGERKLERLQ